MVLFRKKKILEQVLDEDMLDKVHDVEDQENELQEYSEGDESIDHRKEYKHKLLKTFANQDLFLKTYKDQVERSMRSLFFQKPFHPEERDRACTLTRDNFIYDSLDSKASEVANQSLRNAEEIGDVIEVLKKNRHTRQDSGDIKPTPHTQWDDIISAETTVSHVDEKESLTSILGHAGSFIKLFFAYSKKPGRMETIPSDYGNESGLIPSQSSEETFSPSIVQTPARRIREANAQIAQQYLSMQNSIVNKVEATTNARISMLLYALKSKTDEEHEIYQIMEHQAGKQSGMEYTTTVDDILKAKEYVTGLEDSNDETLQFIHPKTIQLIKEYKPPTDHETISKFDQMVMEKKGISDRRYLTEYKKTPQETLQRLSEIREKHTGNLLIKDPFVQTLDCLVRLSPEILAEEITDYIIEQENSPEFREKLELLPENHPQRRKWQEKKDGADLFKLLGLRFVYDHQSTVYKTQDVLIDPAINEIEDPTNKTYAEIIKQRYPEGLDFFQNEDYEDPAAKQLYKDFNDEMVRRKDIPRFYIGADLSPFFVAESLMRDSKSRGREKSNAGIYLDPGLNLEEEMENIRKHYPKEYES